MKRNRSEGWKNAKQSGHKNEHLVYDLISRDKDVQLRILECASKYEYEFVDIECDDINEAKVEGILDSPTTPKPDIKIKLNNDDTIGISLKKSTGGQAFLVSVDSFIEGFQIQYGKNIPDMVQRALSLFFGTADDVDSIIEKHHSQWYEYEKKKHRLTASTLKEFDENLHDCLLKWFDDNIDLVFNFCFSRGLSKKETDWADLLWHKNLIEEDNDMIDEMYNISELEKRINSKAYYGEKYGGTTIQLPFGFLQWHSPSKKIPGSMQFHQDFNKIKLI